MDDRSGASASSTATHSAPPCPVALGDRVATPAGTAGETVYVRWIAPGAHPLVPSRHLPGYWLAIVAEDLGVVEPGEQAYDAATQRREVTAPHSTA